jgi:hypothetical protein
MAAINEVSPGSFDAYEGIRILIPGAIVSAVAYLTTKTVAPSVHIDLSGDAIAWIVASLATGLVLYFLDLPAKAVAFRELQPTEYLESTYPDVPKGEVLTNYLLMLNTVMPANTRNRALYIGSMYRIGFEMIVFGGIGTAAVFACATFDYGPVVEYDRRIFLGVLMVILTAYGLGWGMTAAGRSRSRKRGTSKSGKQQPSKSARHKGYMRPLIAWTVGVLIIFGSAFVDESTHLVTDLIFAVGFLAAITAWVWLYSVGVHANGVKRRARPEVVAAMFGGPIALSIALPRWSHTILGGVGPAVGWSAAAGLVIILMMAGGHEGKLHGVYRGQTRWLKANDQACEALFGPKPPANPPGGPAPGNIPNSSGAGPQAPP